VTEPRREPTAPAGPSWATWRDEGEWHIVTLAGLIDLAELRREIDRLVASPTAPERLIVDLNHAELTDASLERALLVDSTARLYQSSTLIVVCRQPRLLRWFQAAAPQIRVVPTVEYALRRASAGD
jgi:hypothetical protein